MVTESFMNSCFTLIYSKKGVELNPSIYQDILVCLNEGVPKDGSTIPIYVKAKCELLKLVCETKINTGSLAQIGAALMVSEKHKKFEDFISTNKDKLLDANEVAGITKAVRDLTALAKMRKTIDRMKKVVDKATDGTFDTPEELLADWSNATKSAYSDVAEQELKSRTGLVSSINTSEDSYDKLFQEIRHKYSTRNVMPSGVPELDSEFLGGGFQPSRLYMYLGMSGIGKSLILLNNAIRGALSYCPELGTMHLSNDTYLALPPERVFLYVTMENYPYETWMRLRCSLLELTKDELLQTLFNSSASQSEIRERIRAPFAMRHSSIQIEYFPPNTITPVTIAGLLNKYNTEKRKVKAVYLDYMDLLQPDVAKDMYRLDLGEIALGLKAVSAKYEVPIITATQLNREAYKRNKKQELGADMISESIQKLFNVDFSAVMVKDTPTNGSWASDDGMPQKILLKIDKNRDGKTGQTYLYFDYKRAKLLTREEFSQKYNSVLTV